MVTFGSSLFLLPIGSRRQGWRRLPLSSMAVAILALGASCNLEARVGTIESKVGDVTAEVRHLQAQVGLINQSAGRDVNEPVTGWILAGGYALVPLSFIVYLVAHRFTMFRKIKGAVRGEPYGAAPKKK